jgi:hypothetical protein
VQQNDKPVHSPPRAEKWRRFFFLEGLSKFAHGRLVAYFHESGKKIPVRQNIFQIQSFLREKNSSH